MQNAIPDLREPMPRTTRPGRFRADSVGHTLERRHDDPGRHTFNLAGHAIGERMDAGNGRHINQINIRRLDKKRSDNQFRGAIYAQRDVKRTSRCRGDGDNIRCGLAAIW